MTTITTIYQCVRCLRQHDGGGNLLTFQPCAPAPADCGRMDCAEVAGANLKRDAAKRQRRIDAAMARRECKTGKRQGEQSANIAPPARHYSKPFRDADDDAPEQTGPDLTDKDEGERLKAKVELPPSHPLPNPALPPGAVPGLSHREEQHRFASAGDGSDDCERMLSILFDARTPDGKYFMPDDPARESSGGWVASVDFKLIHKILTPNSRASQLRGCDSYTPHPLVKKYRLDIDSAPIGGRWCYRVCFLEHSERLKRENKPETGQSELSNE